MSENRSRKWLKISCIGCVGAPCLVLMLCFGWIKCQVSREGAKLPGELAKLRKMGIPTEPENLNPKPPVSDSDNAALIYAKIDEKLEAFKALGDRRYSSLVVQYTGFPGDTPEYQKALVQYEPVFALIESLRTRSRIDFKRDYSKGFDVSFDDFSKLKNVSKMLSSRVRYWIIQKQFGRALQDVEIQYVVANHLSEEPTLIGGLVCIALNAIAHASLDKLLEAIQDVQPLLAKTEAMLLRRQKLPSIRSAFYGELVLGRIGIQQLRSWKSMEYSSEGPGEPSALEKTLDRMTLEDPAFRKMFEARAVAMWRELFENFPKGETDWPAFRKAFKDLDTKVQADNSLQNKVNQILLPVFDQASTAFAKTDASHRVALLAVRLLRMRPNGLPKDLAAFSKLAIDPMDGKPMRYVRKEDGFKVWSIGGDMVDHHGTRSGTGVSYNQTDIVLGYRIGFPVVPSKPVQLPAAGGPPPGFGGPSLE